MMEPSFRGFIDTTHDALVLLEACNQQQCDRVTRRLQEKERQSIVSGAVYVFDEEESRIKRWTDGRMWSPSRILGNFLVYRELDKRSVDEEAAASAALSRAEEERLYGGVSDESNPRSGRNRERSLVGSLTSTFKFKKGGLVKKTISVGALHLICYYCVEDVLEGRLRTPSSLPELMAFPISAPLLNPSSFRVPPKIEFAPDGTPTFIAEKDENVPPRPSTSRSSFASTSSSLLSPTDTNFSSNTSDYFGSLAEAGSAPSSASSGDARTGSAGSDSFARSPRLTLNQPLSSRVHTVTNGSIRSNGYRARHNPYGSDRKYPSDMHLPGGEEMQSSFDAFGPNEAFSGSPSHQQLLFNQMYESRDESQSASAPFNNYSVSPPQDTAFQIPPYESFAHRNSISSAPRPYTSYDPIQTSGISPTSADFSRSLSDYGRSNRERAASGPSMVPVTQQQMAGSPMPWNPNHEAQLSETSSRRDDYASDAQFVPRYTTDRNSPFSSMYQSNVPDRHQPFASNYPSPLTSCFPDSQHYSMSHPNGRPPSPRSVAPPITSPFYFNAPAPIMYNNPGNDQFFDNNYGRRASASEQQPYQRPTNIIQPMPQYGAQHSPHFARHSAVDSSPEHVPVWLQQQQQSIAR